MKPKVVGILLLFCLVVPIATIFTLLQYRRQQIRREVKQQIIAGVDQDDLVLLKFTEEESQTKLQWEHSKEFEYNGQMYDLVKKETKGDTLYYWCWPDNKETRLNKHLSKLLDNVLKRNPKNTKNQRQLVSFYKSLYFEELPGSNMFSFQGEQVMTLYAFSYSTFSYPPPVPPPERS